MSKASEWARTATPADVEKLLLERARFTCARAALAGELARLAREGHGDIARRIRRRFEDALCRDVSLGDMTTARASHPAVDQNRKGNNHD